MRQWWTDLQPEWRLQGGVKWPLLRKDHPDERWANVAKGGSHGLILVLCGLAWWSKERKDMAEDEFISVFEDVGWVIERIILNLCKRYALSSDAAQNDAKR